MPLCIRAEDAKAFFKANKSLAKIGKMTSEQRIAEFEKYFGLGAGKPLNLEFENKFLLQRQAEALSKWARDAKGGKYESRGKKDFIERIQSMDTLLKGSRKNKPFLETLAASRMGFVVSRTDTATLTKMAAELNKEKATLLKTYPEIVGMTMETFDKRYESDQAFRENINKYSDQAIAFHEQYKEIATKHWEKSVIENIGGTIKSVMSSADLSATLRQLLFYHINTGGKDLITNTKKGIASMFSPEQAKKNQQKLYGNPYAISGLYQKAGLDIGVVEEAFPSSVLENVYNTKWKDIGKQEGKTALSRAVKTASAAVIKGTGLANIANASERAFSTQQQMARANLFAFLFEKSGRDMNKLKQIGEFVNQQTGRGSAVSNDPRINQFVSTTLFSQRWVMARLTQISNIIYVKSFIDAQRGKGDADTFINNEKFKSSARFFAAMAAILFLMDWFDDDEAGMKYNPLSTDFGKIRFGNTRFDPTAGTGAFIRMAAQFATFSKVDSSGKLVAAKPGDILWSGITQRTSPLASLALDLHKWATTDNATSYGTEIGSTQWIVGNMMPLPITNAIESFQEADTPIQAFSAAIADFFGLSANSYDSTPIKADKNTRTLSKSDKKTMDKEANALYETEKAKFRRSREYNQLTAKQRMQIDTDLQKRANEVVKYKHKASKLKNKPLQPWEWVKKNRLSGSKNILKK